MFAEYFRIIKKFKKIALHLKSLLYCTHIHAHKHRRRDLGETTRQSHKSQKTAQNFSRKNRFLHFCFRCFAIRKKNRCSAPSFATLTHPTPLAQSGSKNTRAFLFSKCFAASKNNSRIHKKTRRVRAAVRCVPVYKCKCVRACVCVSVCVCWRLLNRKVKLWLAAGLVVVDIIMSVRIGL